MGQIEECINPGLACHTAVNNAANNTTAERMTCVSIVFLACANEKLRHERLQSSGHPNDIYPWVSMHSLLDCLENLRLLHTANLDAVL